MGPKWAQVGTEPALSRRRSRSSDRHLTVAVRRRLPGYATATPDTLERGFPVHQRHYRNPGSQITVRLNRRTYSAGDPATRSRRHRSGAMEDDPYRAGVLIFLKADAQSRQRRRRYITHMRAPPSRPRRRISPSPDSPAWMSAVTESGGWSASTATRMPRSV
jgi:hypothetical protein